MSALKLQQEQVELQKQIEMLKAQLKEVKASNPTVTVKKVATKKGAVGFTIHGLGMPKFFYKQHALALLGDSEQAIKNRAELVAWINEQTDLTEKS